MIKLKSSQSLQTSAKTMLFARCQHHIRFGSGFPYGPLKAMLTKISKWSRIQDSFRITPKIESLVVFAIPDIPRKFQKDPSIIFRVILLTHRQTDRQIKSSKNITSLAEVKNFGVFSCPTVYIVTPCATDEGRHSKCYDMITMIWFTSESTPVWARHTHTQTDRQTDRRLDRRHERVEAEA